MSATFEREFAGITQTKFWESYVNSIIEAKRKYLTKLQKDPIGDATVKGVIWQENLKLLDEILGLPAKIIILADNKD